MKPRALILIAIAAGILPANIALPAATAGETPAAPAFRNTALPVEQRVDDLLARLTLDEKAFLCHRTPKTQALPVARPAVFFAG